MPRSAGEPLAARQGALFTRRPRRPSTTTSLNRRRSRRLYRRPSPICRAPPCQLISMHRTTFRLLVPRRLISASPVEIRKWLSFIRNTSSSSLTHVTSRRDGGKIRLSRPVHFGEDPLPPPGRREGGCVHGLPSGQSIQVHPEGGGGRRGRLRGYVLGRPEDADGPVVVARGQVAPLRTEGDARNPRVPRQEAPGLPRRRIGGQVPERDRPVRPGGGQHPPVRPHGQPIGCSAGAGPASVCRLTPVAGDQRKPSHPAPRPPGSGRRGRTPGVGFPTPVAGCAFPWPEATSQSFTAPSRSPEARVWPSGLKATPRT